MGEPEPVFPTDAIQSPRRSSFLVYAGSFWRGRTRLRAMFLSVSILLLVMANVAVAYGINRWSASFFNALEHRLTDRMPGFAAIFIGLVAVGAAINVALVLARMTLQVEWRGAVTGRLVRQWLSDRAYYKLNIVGGDHDNPEFRIGEDVRLAIEPLVDFAIGFLNALLAAATFLTVLWSVGGAYTVTVGDNAVVVPAFFVLAAIAYAVVMSAATVWIGRPLIGAVAAKNHREADFRFELTRVRESAESIALISGEAQERVRLSGALGRLVAAWRVVLGNHARITALTNANGVLLPVFPLLIGAPKYISGGFGLGELMQVTAAFVQVQLAFNWIMDNFVRLAEWRASANRVMGLVDGMSELQQALAAGGEMIEIGVSPDDSLKLVGLTVEREDGSVLIEEAETVIERGESVMLVGESGTGKSTLIRAIAGLWPWGSGAVLIPEGAALMFLPQRPYIPLGTLRTALCYPTDPGSIPHERIVTAMERVGLGFLESRLDEVDRWDAILSGGEQQRLAFVRMLLARPDIVVMDEATSALDEASQAHVMEIFRSELSAATIISVAHRPSLAAYHSRTITLKRTRTGSRIQAGPHSGSDLWRRWRKAMSMLGGHSVRS